MECISLCGVSCLCTLSASVLIEPSLHQLYFFQKSLYGDLFLFFFYVRSEISISVKLSLHMLVIKNLGCLFLNVIIADDCYKLYCVKVSPSHSQLIIATCSVMKMASTMVAH